MNYSLIWSLTDLNLKLGIKIPEYSVELSQSEKLNI